MSGVITDMNGPVSIKTTVKDTAGNIIIIATSPEVSDFSKPIVVTASVPSGIKYWTVRAPALYTATVELLSAGATTDSINITTGVRTIRFSAKSGLYVNEENIKMRGFCGKIISPLQQQQQNCIRTPIIFHRCHF